jgi:hypothetical protein
VTEKIAESHCNTENLLLSEIIQNMGLFWTMVLKYFPYKNCKIFLVMLRIDDIF